ncbi:hypothetical protein [Thermomonospora amylolytica]|uniref:hypothetical protein n=1 Tax=Thermomonospora amylolytica TaxID=1411117 RepID=UPI00130037CC|nr:hypothetical protein [Thermomonospora amylolytica]
MVKSSEPLDRSYGTGIDAYGVGAGSHGAGSGGAGGGSSSDLTGLKRFALVMIAIMVLAPLGTALYAYLFLLDGEDGTPVRKDMPFTAEAFFGKDGRLETPAMDFDRTSGTVADGEQGCQAGAVDAGARALLQRLGCRGRVEGTFVTVDRRARLTGHVLRFDDEAHARRAAAALRPEQMRFLLNGRVSERRRYGAIGHQDRYVVIALADGPEEAGGKAVGWFRAEVQNLIIWSTP